MNFVQEHLAGRPDLLRRAFELGGVPLGSKARSGSEYRALCPFHADREHPNLDANLETGLFICRACGAGGDVVDLFARSEGLTVDDAIAALRESLGIGTSGNGSNGNGGTGEFPRDHVPAAPCPRPNARTFWESLAREDSEGISYLESRNLWPRPAGEDLLRFAGGDPYRIAVPLFDSAGDLVNVQRRPAIPREQIQGAPFLPMAGAPVKGTSFGALPPAGPLWILEGMADFLAGALLQEHLGLAPLGIPGVSNAVALVETRADQLRGRRVYVSLAVARPQRRFSRRAGREENGMSQDRLNRVLLDSIRTLSARVAALEDAQECPGLASARDLHASDDTTGAPGGHDMVTGKCAFCGRPFAPSRPWHRFCSNRCRFRGRGLSNQRVSNGAGDVARESRDETRECGHRKQIGNGADLAGGDGATAEPSDLGREGTP